MRRGGQRDGDWTADEIAGLRAVYASATSGSSIGLGGLARAYGRDKTNVCRKARELGLTNQHRAKHANRKPAQTTMFTVPEFQAAIASDRMRRATKANGHPRGALGMHHTAAALAKMSAKARRHWADPCSTSRSPEAAQRRSDQMHARMVSGAMNRGYRYSRAKQGRRADLGDRYFRSSWEANYARYLNFLVRRKDILGWEFEAKTFLFEAVRRGTRSYLPDFRVDYPDGHHEWHEVKGWMDAKSVTRHKRMAKFFPSEKLVIVGESFFKSARRSGLAAIVGSWE